MQKERIRYFDALKLFAIFLVLWGHAVQQFMCGGGSGNGDPVFRAIYAFHMPLFMGIVGYFGLSLEKLNFKEVITKKFRQLMLPAISFGILYSLMVKYGFNVQGRWLAGWIWFWFLKSAFLCCMLFWLGTRWKKHRNLGILLSIGVAIGYGYLEPVLISSKLNHIISIWSLPKMYPCFVIGALFHEHQEKIFRNAKKIFFIALVLWLPMWLLMIWDEKYNYFPYSRMLTSGTAWFGLTEACLSVVVFLLLFKILSDFIPRTAIGDRMCTWGGMTLSIYCLQVFILETIMPKFISFEGTNLYLFDLVYAPLISAGVLLLCVGITKLIRQNALTAYLFLGIKDKSFFTEKQKLFYRDTD